MTSVPDVSVIVPVYNAMPYLSECLTSLVEQTIGHDRMEILAVDDGSTDGSSKELERFASLYPDLLTVVHQPNSGGPAAPCNRALDAARGRYVYFVGADDYLWSEALERLVREADDHGSDVVAGTMVGVNGRYVYPALYAATDHDVSLYDSALPWTMSNVKLFRRSLVEEHGVRFPEDLPVNSDQAFTLEVCVRAGRISVLADGDYYFATLRSDQGNITYRTTSRENLRCATAVMRRAAALLEPGPRRDAILCRHFAWELVKVLTVRFLALDETTQRDLAGGVAALADDYLTDRIRERLSARRRLVLSLAQAGRLDLLREVVREQAAPVQPPLFMDGDRAFVQHAGFRSDPTVDDRWYELFDENIFALLAPRLEPLSLGWAGRSDDRRLVASLRLPVTGPAAAELARFIVRAEPLEPPALWASSPDGTGPVEVGRASRLAAAGRSTKVRVGIDMNPLLSWGAGAWTCALYVDLGGKERKLPLPPGEQLRSAICWHRGKSFRVSSKETRSGRLQLVITPIPRRKALKRQVRARVARVRRR